MWSIEAGRAQTCFADGFRKCVEHRVLKIAPSQTMSVKTGPNKAAQGYTSLHKVQFFTIRLVLVSFYDWN
jgi:hypothetical protein